jgi:hypothetical protein
VIKKGLICDNIKVECECKTVFCFQCNSQPHFPLSCVDFEKWKDVLKEYEIKTQNLKEILGNSQKKSVQVVEEEKDLYPKCPKW